MKFKIIKKIEKPFEIDNFVLPSSKSITIRDFLLAGLASGKSIIKLPAVCDDAWRMRESLGRLGVAFKDIDNNSVEISGVGKELGKKDLELFLGGSGISARFLLALALLRPGKTKITGNSSLNARPQKDLLDVLEILGAEIKSTNNGYLPAIIKGGNVKINKIKMPGNTSSQYFSALMQVAPLLPEGLEIDVIGDLVSKPYIDITINEMRKFGVNVENNKYNKFIIKPQKYEPTNITVEGDASAASYFMALATIHKGIIKFINIGSESKQGDLSFCKICQKLGAKVELEKNYLIISGNGKLKALKNDIDMKNIPDTAQTLMTISPLIPGKIKIVGIKNLKYKECDRISAPLNELKKIGVTAEAGDDYMIINEQKNWNNDIIESTSIDTYDDHRMAMSFAVLGTAIGNLKINDSNCVKKSFPNFWEKLSELYQ